jgi:16S rRNA (guanine966-N2)-methyltransferase
MRIVAGIYGGRKLIAPKNGSVRPTSDKVRGAIFNSLSSLGAIEGANVLDGFCGSGALGLEAISRGAASCLFVDSAKPSLMLAKENAQILGVTTAQFLLMDMTLFEPPENGVITYDLIFLDPPYRKNLESPVIATLIRKSIISESAVIVVESAREDAPMGHGAFTVQSTKIYGDTRVTFFSAS